MPDEEHLGGFPRWFSMLSLVFKMNDCYGECLCDWLLFSFCIMLNVAWISVIIPQFVDEWSDALLKWTYIYIYISVCMIAILNLDLSRRSNWCESTAPHKLRQLWGGKEGRVAHDDMYLCSVAQNWLLCPAILLPSLSSLAASQGTILPWQSWKHGSDAYLSMRYLRWDCICFAGVADGACSIRLVSWVVVGSVGCTEPGSHELGKVANTKVERFLGCRGNILTKKRSKYLSKWKTKSDSYKFNYKGH